MLTKNIHPKDDEGQGTVEYVLVMLVAVVIATVNRALGESAARARVTVERTWRVGGPAIVRVEVPHRVMSRLFGGFEVLLRGTATMRVEN